jgi:hypothetical protein
MKFTNGAASAVRRAAGALLAVSALATGHQALGAAPTRQQLEEAAVRQALHEDETSSMLDAFAMAFEDGAKTRIDFLRALLADAEVARRSAQWLSTVPDPAALPAYWTRHYLATMAVAVRHLDDAEIDFIFGRFIAPAAAFEETRCARLFHRDTPIAEVPAALGLTRADVAEFYRIVGRVYRAASSDRPVPPSRDAEALQAALRDVARHMPPSTREAFVDGSSPARPGSREVQGCLLMRAVALALKDVPGESGRLARRDLVATLMRPAPGPGADRAPPDVRGAASARFQPGVVALEYPAAAARAGVEGQMMLKIWVDAEGRATRLQTIRHSLRPAEARLADGTTVPSEQLFEPILSSFYKAGRFTPHVKDGVAQGYVVEVPIEWRLE